MNKTLQTILKHQPEINYLFENDRLVINGSLYLHSLTSVDKDFLKDTTINGSLILSSLTHADKDFLKDTTINGNLYLDSLTSVDKDFLKGTTINGGLYLRSLTSVDKDFLKDTTINGSLDLGSLKSVDKDFLKDTTINGSLNLSSLTHPDKHFLKDTTIDGSLYLASLTSVDKDFLKDTTINGYLDLSSLTHPDKDFLKDTTINGYLYLSSLDKDQLNKNVKQLQEGYNKEKSYCFFDRILTKVKKVSKKKDYTIYHTPSGFVIQKDKFTAHAKSIKQGIIDLNFKIYVSELKHSKLKLTDKVDIKLYRAITGACEQGVKQWMNNTGVKENITVSELLKVFKDHPGYGMDKFKELVEN